MKPFPRFGSSFSVPLTDLSPEEMQMWIRQKRDALQQKMQRERAYLARRATRGIHTVTDDAYEADQLLEIDLLALLDLLEENLHHLI